MFTLIGSFFSNLTATTLGKTLTKVVTVGGILLIIAFILSLLPTISLPHELYNFLLGRSLQEFFSLIYYLVPLDAILGCLFVILLLKQAGLLISFTMFVYHFFRNTGE